MSKPLLEARGLNLTYREGTRGLSDVDFELYEKDFVALAASNGSGKTTLIKTLVGLLTPQSGTVRLRGVPVAKIQGRSLFREIGVVMQNPQDQLFGPTVADDIAFGPRNLGIEESEIEKRVSEVLDAVGLEGVHDRAVHHLSFGQQKRVCVAGALAMKPAVLLLDEPTAGLDPVGEASMIRLLHRLNLEQGLTIVLATHSVDLLPLFANRIVILSRGRVERVGPPDDIFTDPDALAEMGLRLPYISHLFHELRGKTGIPVETLPLTIGEARRRLVDLIPSSVIQSLKPDEDK